MERGCSKHYRWLVVLMLSNDLEYQTRDVAVILVRIC